ncbi:hypothetical protein CHU32_22600 [Superficieibacter electus]|uniref:Acyltransferase n=1 Tax=Superficieibacter electus TaxID=2022662 RepID=A0A2P5GJ75_9ENTR|nr:hypothetical protein [Superficieibacter electus]POP41390.1 hypothetical protein CHU33_23210 [Superficieibacter electus]POP43712.1 hypothetical protein CHU32_22600 [Superficieibacter electus]
MDKIFNSFSERATINVATTAHIAETVNFNIEGQGHRINIEDGVILRNITINMSGENGYLHIKRSCNLRGSIHIRQENSTIVIGQRTTFVAAHLFALEGCSIVIGDDCMFSSGVIIRTSDEHSIIDLENNVRVNKAKDIFVKDHVWIGEGVTLNKGSEIPRGCVIGAKSLVLGRLDEESSVYAGCPVRFLKGNIIWDRKLI